MTSEDFEKLKKFGCDGKYDLCENEIQYEGHTIAYADNSIFDIKDKEEFKTAVYALGWRLGWMVERANAVPELIKRMEKMEQALKNVVGENVGNVLSGTLTEGTLHRCRKALEGVEGMK